MQPTKKLESKASMDSMKATLQWKRAALMAKTISAFKDTTDDSDEDVDTKQQIRYGKPSQAAWAIFSEYCDNSTIHGIKYLGEQKRPCWERLFWIMVFVCSIYLCASLTMNIWWKWNNNPVIVSFAEKSTPVWQIPFPTVTICMETKSRQTHFNFTDVYWRFYDYNLNATAFDPITEEELKRLHSIFQVCDTHMANGDQASNRTNGAELIEILGDVMPTFNDTFHKCKWRNLNMPCNELFAKYVTDDGLCYSFNALSPAEVYRADGLVSDFIFRIENRTATDWNVEEGYNINADTETYPNRVLGPGAKAGLDLLLNGIVDDFDNLCRGPVQGFKILLHTPGEVAQVSKQYFRVPFDQEVLIAIKPKIITTSDGLKHYEPNRRQCYFQKERDLRYFQIYTQNNCELECVANFTLAKCGCVKYSMPRHADVPVCGSEKINCFYEAEDELFLREFNQGISAASDENYRVPTTCNCLPACTSIAYEAEISQADYDYTMALNNGRSIEAAAKTKEVAKVSKKSKLSIFFKEAQFLTSKRSELYGTTDFLANCGGLLGLFMGVSTLSIVEIIYFCTVRLITNLKMRRKKRKELNSSEKSENDKKA